MTETEFIEFLSQLESSEVEERVDAVKCLAPFARYLQRAVEALIDSLLDAACVVRAAAAHELGRLDPPAADALQPLIDALEDPMACVREKAAEALYLIGPDSCAAVAALKKAMDDPEIACTAIDALGAIGPPAASAIPVLMKAINDSHLCEHAMLALGGIGSDAKQAVPRIAEFLGSPKISLRRTAAEALGLIGPAAADSLPQLLKTFQDQKFFQPANRPSKGRSAQSRPDLYPEAAGDLQVDIALAIWRIWQHPLAIPMLVERLQDEDIDVRLRALDGLWEIGLPAVSVTADIARLTEDPDPLIRSRALRMLASCVPVVQGVLPLILAAVDDPESLVRSHAAEAIGDLESAGPKAVDALLMLLDDEDVMVRLAAAAALWRVGQQKAAITALMSMLDESGFGSEQAAMQLAAIGPAARVSIPTLLRFRHSKDIAIRWSARYAIECITGLPHHN